MPKITFMGAGSTVFAKNVLGDSMMTPALEESTIALYDIDATRLDESAMMLEAINRNNGSKAKIEKYLGAENRKEALRGANYVVNAIQVGGYDPCTITDFEIPKKYGLKQTIADTLGVGGVFRALRTIPVMLDFAHDMEEVCPDAWLLNYTNPMAMLTGAMLRLTGVKTVGLCHSVQACASTLLKELGMPYDDTVQWKIAGINHQAWLLELTRDGVDLYPEVKRRALLYNQGRLDIGTLEERIAVLTQGEELPGKWIERLREEYELYKKEGKHGDMVRLELMRRFGYYITESSEHRADRPLQHPAGRVSPPLHPPDPGVEGARPRADPEPDADPQAHPRVRQLHHGGHGDQRAHEDRRQRAEQRPDHQPAPQRLRGGALPGGQERHPAHLYRRPARAVRGAEPHQHQRAAADHRGRPHAEEGLHLPGRHDGPPRFLRAVHRRHRRHVRRPDRGPRGLAAEVPLTTDRTQQKTGGKPPVFCWLISAYYPLTEPMTRPVVKYFCTKG